MVDIYTILWYNRWQWAHIGFDPATFLTVKSIPLYYDSASGAGQDSMDSCET